MVILAFAALIIVGALLTIKESDPFRKLISLGIMIGGVIPFIVDRGLLDVAIAVALIAPLSTIFTLMVCGRGEE
ncbi:MAG: EhaD family protein [Methanolinea sp.]|jgi:energy-converting hydrogenase A subunit D|nr:EhaD family protein [Methanolinea sp.]